MSLQVAAFTDSYLPTVNGVTYTIDCWRDRFRQRGDRMDVVYPRADGHDPRDGEHPVTSVAFPWYDGYRIGTPRVPDAVRDADVVHAHTAFAVGLGGLRLARDVDAPFVASYHTPVGEYTDYIAPTDRLAAALTRFTQRYEQWFFDRADVVFAPSPATRDHLVETVGVDSPVRVVSNGVDTEFFRPVDTDAFRARHDLPDGTLVGYTGRHGYEKRLSELVAAAEGLDATVVLGGDGPARADLESQAETVDADVRFLGFLDREELPAFYSALDVFAFPSPVETEGLVALEANACGTPVVGVDAGALAETVVEGETGYHFPPGDVPGFREGIRRALDDRERLTEECLARRDVVSVSHVIEEVRDVYAELRSA